MLKVVAGLANVISSSVVNLNILVAIQKTIVINSDIQANKIKKKIESFRKISKTTKKKFVYNFVQLLAFIAVFDFCTALRMSIQNLNSRDPFADAIKGPDDDIQDGLVHIRIQQRNGRKTLTTVQGLSAEYDLKKIVRSCKKEFACNGTVIEHPEYGEVLQLQGDQRENICQWLTKVGLAKADRLKVHGF